MNLLPSNNVNLYGYKDRFLEFKKLYDENLLSNKIMSEIDIYFLYFITSCLF